MLVVEALHLRVLVEDDAESGHVVDDLAALVNIEQIIATIVTTISRQNKRGRYRNSTQSHIQFRSKYG